MPTPATRSLVAATLAALALATGCVTRPFDLSDISVADGSSHGGGDGGVDFAIDLHMGCSSNDDCVESSTGHICWSGQCVVCGTDFDCGGERCLDHRQCVQCLTSADCPFGGQCINNTCEMSGGCNSDKECPPGLVCDPMSRLCRSCTSDGECAMSPWGPRCDPMGGLCVPCLPQNDNCPTGEFCSGEQCVPGCKSDADCATSNVGPRCDLASHQCVQCFTDGDCAGGLVCVQEKCVMGCDNTHPCPTGEMCVGGVCQSTAAKRVFVTSIVVSGAMGGLAGADNLCNKLAFGANLGGKWMAWLSDDTGSPATRFPTHNAGPYVLVDGSFVASSWQALVTTGPVHAIDVTESGGKPPSSTTNCGGLGTPSPTVWTNTNPDGTLSQPGASCGRWTDTNGGSLWGNWSDPISWTSWCSGGTCSWTSALYCFEQ